MRTFQIPREEVYAAIDSERDYQDMRQTRDDGQEFHSIEEFLLYMKVYLDDTINVAAKTWGPEAGPKTLDALRKVVTLGVACMEQHGAPQRAGFEHDVLTLTDNDHSGALFVRRPAAHIVDRSRVAHGG